MFFLCDKIVKFFIKLTILQITDEKNKLYDFWRYQMREFNISGLKALIESQKNLEELSIRSRYTDMQSLFNTPLISSIQLECFTLSAQPGSEATSKMQLN